MPLTPLPATNTKRYFIKWTAGGLSHSTQVRVSDDTDNAFAVSFLQNDLAILLPALGTNVVIDGLDVAENGSDIRNPVAGWTVLTGTGGVDVTGQDRARSFSLRGRSATGRKTKALFWGFVVAHQPDFELALADQSAAQSDFQAQVQARNNQWLAIDGTKPNFGTNYLEDYNDHWEKELRP
jgi:hypothetical protein